MKNVRKLNKQTNKQTIYMAQKSTNESGRKTAPEPVRGQVSEVDSRTVYLIHVQEDTVANSVDAAQIVFRLRQVVTWTVVVA